MANQDAQDRNLPASPRRLEKAREEGQVARSRDLGHFAAVAAGGAVMLLFAPTLTDALAQMLRRALHFNARSVAEPALMGERLAELAQTLMWVALPIGVLMAGRRAGERRRLRRLGLELEAAGPEVRQVQPAHRPGAHGLEAAARRHAQGEPAGAAARRHRRVLPARPPRRVRRRARAAAAGRAGAGRPHAARRAGAAAAGCWPRSRSSTCRCSATCTARA